MKRRGNSTKVGFNQGMHIGSSPKGGKHTRGKKRV